MTYLAFSFGWMIFPLINLYRNNADAFSPSVLWRPLVVFALAHILFYGVLRLRFRDEQSGVLLSFVWIGFFLVGPMETTLGIHRIGYATIWALWLAIGIAVVLTALRWHTSPLKEPWKAVAWVGAFLGLLQIALLTPKLFSKTVGITMGESTRPMEVVSPSKDAYPNIFYIVLDGYGRQDVLKELYGFDNEPFLRHLEGDGFNVLRGARSNYSHTILSLASSLNMGYLQDFGLPLEGERSIKIIQPILKKNRVMMRLRKSGYRFVALETGYDMTELKDADRYVRLTTRLNEFESGLLQTTLITRLPFFTRLSPWVNHQRRVLGAFHALERLSAETGPHFVFAHIVCPHPPFVFDAEGRFPGRTPNPDFMASGSDLVCRKGLSVSQHRALYRNQLTYLNRLIEKSLSKILSPGNPPALIILQGDHGPDSETFHYQPERTNRFERFNILFAVHAPPGWDLQLPQDLTPVNLFRAVLSRGFGEKLPPFPNKQYLSATNAPYRFIFCQEATLRPR